MVDSFGLKNGKMSNVVLDVARGFLAEEGAPR
jgi:hypothetical protein